MICANCNSEMNGADYFCLSCGEMNPFYPKYGEYSVLLSQVSSLSARSYLINVLRKLRPSLDVTQTDVTLASGDIILMSRLDQDSALGLQKWLNALQLPADIIRVDRSGQRLPKLPIFVGALAIGLLGLLIGGIGTLILVPAAIAAPVVAWWLDRRRKDAVIPIDNSILVGEKWAPISQRFAALIKSSNKADLSLLREVFKEIFNISDQLRSGSLVSIAAGHERGALSEKLIQAGEIAVRSAEELSSDDEQAREDIRLLLSSLRETSAWRKSFAETPLVSASQVSEDLKEITRRIDDIVKEVREPGSFGQGIKTTVDRRKEG
jgi:hypothetical protein